MSSKKERFYYFYDERNDDFANNGIDGKATPENYQYFPKNIFYRIFKPILYYFFLLIFAIVYKCGQGYPIKNYKVIRNRKDKKKGYFVYGNHTTWIGDAVAHPMKCFPRQCYTICNPDAISIKGAGTLIHMFGATPTPSARKTFGNFMKAVEKIYENGNPMVIFPEAHIWPKYNEIRDFPATSFYYPVKYNAACFTKTTVYKKKKDGHTTAVVYYDGPFYPDTTLSFKQAQNELRDRIYNQMVERTKESELDCDYHYIRVDDPSQVRSEFKEK